jgi:DNA-binding MurR/RpiR family transcriptional regulator
MEAASTEEKSLVKRIHEEYEGLPTGERKVADLVLDFPGELAAYSASEMAKLAQVSNATVTRLFQRLGYDSFEEARRSSRQAREWGSPLFLATDSSRKPAESGESSLLGFAEKEAILLQAALAELTQGQVDEITTALAKARNLGFMGFRNSYYFAAYARWQFIQFRKKTRMIPGAGETVAERIADLGKGDVVLVVGVRRMVGILKRYMKAISKTGASVLLITDPSVREIPAFARWTITCPVENPHVFDSYAGVLAVIRLLAYETFRKAGKPGRDYMQQIEAQHEELAEFE